MHTDTKDILAAMVLTSSHIQQPVVYYTAPKHHGWPDVPSQRKRRILERRARAFAGRMVAR